MVANLVNFTYEYDLFNVPPPVWMRRVLQPSLECLYFYCDEEAPLASTMSYSSEFLNSLAGVVTTPTTNDHLWWGEINELARQTNSKTINHQVNRALNLWTPAGGIVHTWQEINQLMDEGRWRLKDPWLMGGTGQWRLDRQLLHDEGMRRGIESRLGKGPLLLEKTLQLKRVLGTTFELKEDACTLLFTVENDLNSQGNFQGGRIVETPISLQKDLERMAHYWWEKGARGIFEIDSFEHLEGWYPCVEINHRRTMGWFIWHLTKKLGAGSLVLENCTGTRLNPIDAPMPAFWVKA